MSIWSKVCLGNARDPAESEDRSTVIIDNALSCCCWCFFIFGSCSVVPLATWYDDHSVSINRVTSKWVERSFFPSLWLQGHRLRLLGKTGR